MARSYTYPNQSDDPDALNVLRNTFGIRSASALHEVEYTLTRQRQAELFLGLGPSGSFDANHLKAIHHHIFQDVYEWAGHTRNERPFVDGERVEPIGVFGKESSAFLHGSRIEMGLSAALGPLSDLSDLRGSTVETFSARAGEVLGELNYVHPFREGNGRTQEAFIHQLGAHVGHEVDFTVITRARMIEASIQVHHNPNSYAMRHLVEDAVDPGRRETLRSMLQSLQRAGVDSQEYSIRTARLGEEITGHLMGAESRIPALVTGVDIVAVRPQDLPTVISAQDRVVTISVRTPFEIEPPSRMTALDTGMPFIPAVTQWTYSVEHTVARTVEAHPTVRAFLQDAELHAGHVWKHPEAAIQKIREEIARDPDRTFPIIRAAGTDPQAYGELLGGRTMLLQPDAERQTAIEQAPHFGSSLIQVYETGKILEPTLRQAEVAWRKEMATPLPALSTEASNVVRELVRAHEMTGKDREPAHQTALQAVGRTQAWSEVQTWRQSVEKRLAVPDAIERIPGLSEDRRHDIKTTVSVVDSAVREGARAVSRESSRERSQDISQNRSRDTGYGY
ncbi:Fic family protein [Aureimonas sp. AU12]|uniref:Fic/DOC family protein n=1 Tax=Aureimonas sp. AU12 TaxID=1638161 RepID=UPI0009E82F4F|nr:Fic family protein [Aureimonas sp. AU12]